MGCAYASFPKVHFHGQLTLATLTQCKLTSGSTDNLSKSVSSYWGSSDLSPSYLRDEDRWVISLYCWFSAWIFWRVDSAIQGSYPRPVRGPPNRLMADNSELSSPLHSPLLIDCFIHSFLHSPIHVFMFWMRRTTCWHCGYSDVQDWCQLYFWWDPDWEEKWLVSAPKCWRYLTGQGWEEASGKVPCDRWGLMTSRKQVDLYFFFVASRRGHFPLSRMFSALPWSCFHLRSQLLHGL